MFNPFQKKSKFEIQIDSNEIAFGGKLSGRVTIIPSEDFVSNSLQIRLNWAQTGVFANDEPFSYPIQDGINYISGVVTEMPFEIEFITREKLESWYDENARGLVGDEEYENHKAFIEEVTSKWVVEAYFDIPGFDVSSEVEVSVIQGA